MCRFGNGTECLLNDVAGSERDSDRDRWMIPTTALGLSRSRTARPRQSRPSEPKHHGGVLALRHHGGGWDRDHVAQPLSHAWPTQVGANLVGRHLAEMGGIVIWRIIWCSAEGATEASVYRPHLRSASAPPPRRLPRQGGLCVLAPVHPRPRRARSAVDQAGVRKRRARRLAAHLRLDGH